MSYPLPAPCVNCGEPNPRSDPSVPYPFCSASCMDAWDNWHLPVTRPASPEGSRLAMRTLARSLVNLAFLAGTAAALGVTVTSKAYEHASHGARIAIPVVIAAVAFSLACVVLGVLLPARKRTPPRPSFTPAVPRRRGR